MENVLNRTYRKGGRPILRLGRRKRQPTTMMRKFSFGTRMVYFALISAISITFLAFQIYITSQSGGGGAILLTVLWGIMALFGVGGMVFTLLTKKRSGK